jgi:hypothetical protein
MQTTVRYVFDGSNFRSAQRAHRGDAGPDGLIPVVYCAGAAARDTATELRPGQPEDVPQIPEEWHGRIALENAVHTIHFESNHDCLSVKRARGSPIVQDYYA